jgi:uncharacterized repeat protein (TIGR03803 family)
MLSQTRAMRYLRAVSLICATCLVISGCAGQVRQTPLAGFGSPDRPAPAPAAGMYGTKAFPVERTLSPNTASEKTLYTFPYWFQTGYLMADARENLYGTYGGVFELSRKQSRYVQSRSYQFAGGNGNASLANPVLALDSDGALYGDSLRGGNLRLCPQENGCGVVFELVPHKKTFTYSTLYSFLGGYDGETPMGGLIRDAAGALYGVTNSGGTGLNCDYGCGTVFKLTPTASGYVESLIYSFQNLTDGAYPSQALTMDAAGNLYGLAQGGSYINPFGGTAFELSPTSNGYIESTLYQFQPFPSQNENFLTFSSPLVLGGDGRLYGTTANGGGVCAERTVTGCGTVYALTPRAHAYHLQLLHQFTGKPDGAVPGGLTLVGRQLYGTTYEGGANDLGMIYEVDLTHDGTLSTVFSFADSPPDYLPNPGLVTLKGGSRLIGEAEVFGNSSELDVFEVDQGPSSR